MKRMCLPVLLAALLVLTGCGPEVPETAVYAPPDSERLVVYTSHKEEVFIIHYNDLGCKPGNSILHFPYSV